MKQSAVCKHKFYIYEYNEDAFGDAALTLAEVLLGRDMPPEEQELEQETGKLELGRWTRVCCLYAR